jgi:hypothetical protein
MFVSGIMIDDRDLIIQDMLKNNWFSKTSNEYLKVITENINFIDNDQISLLDIGAHLGLWTIRIANFAFNNGIKFNGYLYEPNSEIIPSLQYNVKKLIPYSSKIKIDIYNYAVATNDTDVLKMSFNNENNSGSFDYCEDGTIVKCKIPNHDLKECAIIILPCMSVDFEIMKTLSTMYFNQNILVVSQLIEKNMVKIGSKRQEAIDFMINNGFKYKRYDFENELVYLNHTFFAFKNYD